MKRQALVLALLIGLFLGAVYVGLQYAFPEGEQPPRQEFTPAEYLRATLALGALIFGVYRHNYISVLLAGFPVGQYASEWYLAQLEED